MLLTEEQAYRRVDGLISAILGCIIDRYANETGSGLANSASVIYSTALCKRLCDHETEYYLLDPLELYEMLMDELKPSQ